MRCAIRLWVSIALSILLGACGNDPPAPEPAEVPALQALSPEEQLVRASMTLRQVRPSADELAQVRNNPAALESIVDAYLESPEFLVVMRDMHAELFLLRTDTFNQLPALGLLQGYNLQDIYVSQTEEPLKLIEHVIANDMPYTEIVTADYIMVSPYTARGYGIYEEVKERFKDSQDRLEYIPVRLKALTGRSKKTNQESKTGVYPHAGIHSTLQ